MKTPAAAPPRLPAKAYSEVQLLTAQLGAILGVLLALQFLSGALFYLYVFFYDAPPWFTFTRVLHFYVGIALIPVVLAKYGATGLRAAGYYLHVERYHRLGPPPLLARLTSPLLALDFFALIGSGLYMLLHLYYTHTNIPPFELKPVQTHAAAAFIAVPLLGLHFTSHVYESLRAVKVNRDLALAADAGARAVYSRRGFLAAVALSGVGLAVATQNGPLSRGQACWFFIGRGARNAPPGQRFPIETLFGDKAIAPAEFTLAIGGAVAQPGAFSLADLARLPVHSRAIRTNCVSGWSSVNVWSGYLVRDVLALAGGHAGVKRFDLPQRDELQRGVAAAPAAGRRRAAGDDGQRRTADPRARRAAAADDARLPRPEHGQAGRADHRGGFRGALLAGPRSAL